MNRILRGLLSEKSYYAMLRHQGLHIGEGCDICRDVEFGSEPYLIWIGDHVRITSGVKFVTHDGGMWTLRGLGWLENADRFGEIRIGRNTHIGLNSILMPGVHIGENCIIGCGAVVTHDIPSGSVAVGVPARVIQTVEEYYEKNRIRCVKTKHLGAAEKRKYLEKAITSQRKTELVRKDAI